MTILLSLILFITPAVFAEGPGRHPDNIRKNIQFVRRGNQDNLISEVEYTKVLHVDFDSIVEVLSDLGGYAELFPNVKESRLVSAGGNEINRVITATYEVMGLGRSYKYLEKINISNESDCEFSVESIMIKSLDQQIHEYRGVWSLRRLPDSADGRSRTSVSLYSYFEYNRPFFLQDVVLATFTDEEVATMFECVEEAGLIYFSTK